MKRCFAVLFACAFIFSNLATADEGMWLYNAPPKDKIKAKYGFELTQEWLDHVRLSSVRFNNGGSGSFVSADGLTFTNHHVGAGCVQQLSTAGHDYIKTGFYAKTQAEEAKCPNLELNQLVGIQDVSDKVNAGVKDGMSAADAGQAQRAAMSQVEKDCTTTTGLRCDVVIFYSGQVYNLYKYKKYTDVRLVFAPEFDIAFFGGDPDNFNYPRYDLDITFFPGLRGWQAGAPRQLSAVVAHRRERRRPDLRLRTSRKYRSPADHGATRIPAGRAVPGVPEALPAAHRAVAGLRQTVGRERPHRQGRSFYAAKLAEGHHRL